MAVNEVVSAYETFTNVDGTPLDSGYIYIGEPNLNAEANPKQAYWDEGLTIPAGSLGQAIRTSGGYPFYEGSPARIYVDGDYSIVVKDRRGQLVYAALSNVTADLPEFISIQFETYQDLVDATINTSVKFVSADGLFYVQDSSGTAATSNGGTLNWSPTRDRITFDHWGTAGDGETDDTAKIHACLDWVGSISKDNVLLEDAKNTFGGRVKVTGRPGKVYGLSDQYVTNNNDKNIEIADASLIAVGTWTSGETIARTFDTVADMIASGSNVVGDFVTTSGADSAGDGLGETYEIVASGTYENTDGKHYIELTGISGQARRVDLFMFDGGGLGSYISFSNLRINCQMKCGAIKARARARVLNSWIDRVRHVGVECAGTDVWVHNCIIGQWTTNDVEYYDPTQFTGIGIVFSESDARVTSCTIRWLDILFDVNSTNNIVANCHIFNGMQGYMFADRDTDLNDDLDDYFGWASGTAAVTNLTRRTAHIGVRGGFPDGVGGKFWANDFDNVYSDNCHHELYVDGFSFTNPKMGSKSTSSLNTADSPGGTTPYGDAPTIDYWFKLHAYESNAKTQFSCENFRSFVTSAPRHVVKFVPGAGSWDADTSDISNDETLNYAYSSGARQFADGFTVKPPQVHVGDPFQNPLQLWYGMRDNARVSFANNSQAGDPTDLRVLGDAFQVRPQRVTKFEVNTDGPRMVSPTVPASASDTGVAGQYAYDADYIYICTATDTWKRVAIATW